PPSRRRCNPEIPHRLRLVRMRSGWPIFRGTQMSEEIPVHFHLPGIEPSALEKIVADGVDLHWQTFCNGPEAWCLQTYVHLRTCLENQFPLRARRLDIKLVMAM